MKNLRFFVFLGIDRDPFGKLPCASGNRLRVSSARLVEYFRSWWRSESGENFRSWWWRSVSSPLQVSGAVTRLAVYRAAPHNLQRRGYYSVSNIQARENVGKVGTQCNVGENLGEVLFRAGNSAIRFGSG